MWVGVIGEEVVVGVLGDVEVFCGLVGSVWWLFDVVLGIGGE